MLINNLSVFARDWAGREGKRIGLNPLLYDVTSHVFRTRAVVLSGSTPAVGDIRVISRVQWIGEVMDEDLMFYTALSYPYVDGWVL